MKNIRYFASLEILEDRCAPAVFWVVTDQDNNQGEFSAAQQRNQGSLRWAITQANNDNVNDEIICILA